MAIPEEIDMEVLKEQLSGLRLLCELSDPAPLLNDIRKLAPGYTGRPEGKGAAEKAGQPGGQGAAEKAGQPGGQGAGRITDQ